jgi:hypothetical protein
MTSVLSFLENVVLLFWCLQAYGLFCFFLKWKKKGFLSKQKEDEK